MNKGKGREDTENERTRDGAEGRRGKVMDGRI